MTVALARRLVWDGVITEQESNAALLVHVRDRIPFLRALIQSSPSLLPRLEAELASSRGASTSPVIPDAALVALLPAGLPAALLAVPVSKDPATGTVRVLVADATDHHVAEELSHHFRAKVDVAVAPLRVLLDAVRARSEPPPERGSSRTPAFGVRVVAPSSPHLPEPRRDPPPRPSPVAPPPSARASEPPIPLVRVSPEIPVGPTTVKGVAPQASGASFASPVVVPPRIVPTTSSEPVIQLTRTKSLAPSPPSSPSSEAPATLHGAPAPSKAQESLEAILVEFAEAEAAEDVVAILVKGLSQVARAAIVLAVRGKVFEGRDANDPALRDRVRALVVSADRPSVLLTASQTGEYLGPMPQTLVHQELHRLLGEPTSDIAVGSVTVSGRAALLYAAAGLDTAYLATRRGAALASAAGKALERIVRERTRRGKPRE